MIMGETTNVYILGLKQGNEFCKNDRIRRVIREQAEMQKNFSVRGTITLEMHETLERGAEVVRGGFEGRAARGDVVCAG